MWWGSHSTAESRDLTTPTPFWGNFEPPKPTPAVRALVGAVEAVMQPIAEFAHVDAELGAQAVVLVGLAAGHFALGTCRAPKGTRVSTGTVTPWVPTPSLSRGRGTGRFMGAPPSPAQGDLISIINWKNYKGSQALFLSSSEKKQGMETNNKHSINPLTA